MKANPFYARGLGPPFVFSCKAFRDRQEGWRRSEGPVRFYRNSAAAAVNYILEGCAPPLVAGAAPAATPAAAAPAAGSAGSPGGVNGIGATAPTPTATPGVQHWTYDPASPAVDLRQSYFSLEFEYSFAEETGDRVFFASCLPYTYSDLMDLTAAVQATPQAQQVMRAQRQLYSFGVFDNGGIQALLLYDCPCTCASAPSFRLSMVDFLPFFHLPSS